MNSFVGDPFNDNSPVVINGHFLLPLALDLLTFGVAVVRILAVLLQRFGALAILYVDIVIVAVVAHQWL